MKLLQEGAGLGPHQRFGRIELVEEAPHERLDVDRVRQMLPDAHRRLVRGEVGPGPKVEEALLALDFGDDDMFGLLHRVRSVSFRCLEQAPA